MPDAITIYVNGQPITVQSGITVAAALLNEGFISFHKSEQDQPRAPLCGMGVCYECRVTINKVKYCRSCQIICSENMEISTDD